ncbi:MAG: hypothetical protein GY711_26555 [bacterium]|nr:hypothetical protein [bacterium]
MQRFPSHLLTAAVAAMLSGFVARTPQGPMFTEKHRDILRHMQLAPLPDGQGGEVRTLRISNVNVQIVNGVGATNGVPDLPNQTVTNGLGNLIVGYNELGNPDGDERTGSHNLIVGARHTCTGFGGA